MSGQAAGRVEGSRLGVEVVPVEPTQPPVTRVPVIRVPGRSVLRGQMPPFTTGMLVTGLAVGGPVSVVSGVLDGQVGVVAFPAAVGVVVWRWWRCEGWAGIGRDLSVPLVEHLDMRQAGAGAVTMLAALAWLVGGGAW